ncbi:unnamed protein product [Euphydryas editha]|uniref:Uncharacterized protein n=1 Tax=Euphydryas editha TaxID=104508 RepID=A0AAU9V9J0_EUPED|nr:unnamed protein product [Euphydryas editha]
MSDHKQIFLQLNRYKPPRKIRSVYEAIDYKKLHAEIGSCGIKDATDNYEDFELKLKQCIAHNRVLKTKILNTPKKDWINNDIITEIRQRNFLWIQHKTNRDDKSLEKNFKEKRDIVSKLIENTKKSYYHNLFVKCSRNPKKCGLSLTI